MPDTTLPAVQRAKAAVIGALAAPLMGALCRTYRWELSGESLFGELAARGAHPILALWHGRILPGVFHLRRRGIVVITSRNFDGEWIARILRRYGFGTARGSTSRGGVRALVQMRKALASGRAVAFTVDGPRGPARVAQPGAVWLAGATGHPILPFHIEADRYWTLSSWDRTQIPKPFARVAIAFGPPLRVASTEPAVVEAMRLELEAALGRLETRTREMLGGRSEPAVADTTRVR